MFAVQSSDTLKRLPPFPKGFLCELLQLKCDLEREGTGTANEQEFLFYEAVRHPVKTRQVGIGGKELKSR